MLTSQRSIGTRRIAWTALAAAGFVAGTMFGPSLATAAQKVTEVFVTNTASDPVPVHEQGTANVNVTNGSLTVAAAAPVTGGGGEAGISVPNAASFSPPRMASALSIHLNDPVDEVVFEFQGATVALVGGPAAGGNSSIVLALTRPIEFDEILCLGNSGGFCSVGWVGNAP